MGLQSRSHCLCPETSLVQDLVSLLHSISSGQTLGPHSCFPQGQRLVNMSHLLDAFWRKGISTQEGVCSYMM